MGNKIIVANMKMYMNIDDVEKYLDNLITRIGDNMQVKLFDCESEKDLEEDINDFLENNIDVVDIKYQVSLGLLGEEQIYCFSAMVIYYKK